MSLRDTRQMVSNLGSFTVVCGHDADMTFNTRFLSAAYFTKLHQPWTPKGKCVGVKKSPAKLHGLTLDHDDAHI